MADNIIQFPKDKMKTPPQSKKELDQELLNNKVAYVEDVARGIILAAEKYNKSDPVNLASGNETSIKEIAEVIKKKIGYEGKITWDENKPTGPKRRVVDISRAKKEFGYQAKTSLEEGINKTIDWYIGKNLNLNHNTLS